MERLDKWLCTQSAYTRREAGQLIRSGRVTVDGTVCRRPEQKVNEETAVIAVDGKPIGYQKYIYRMLNKPAGILCVSRDPKAPTVVDLVPEEERRRGLFPAGRLDKDTHGMVLLTDDGAFAHEILSPRHHIPKTYRAVLDKPLDDTAAAAFAAGPTLADGTKCLPAEVRIIEPGENPLVEVVIFEGKFHQIKRMFSAVGCTVIWLKRIAMGGLSLDESLAEGESRLLTVEEKSCILYENPPSDL